MRGKTRKYIGIFMVMVLLMGVMVGCTEKPIKEITEKVQEIEEVQKVQEEEPEELEPYSYFEGIEVYFVDVGQGDSAVVVAENKEAIVIDAGEQRDARAILDVMEKAGVREVALLVATHPHADHIGGMEAILEEYDVREVLMSSHVATTKVFENLLARIESQGKGITHAEVGREWKIGGVFFDILGVDTVPTDNNNSSIVMRMEYGETSILFTGDLEERAEKIVVEEQGSKLESDVLSVGHHGSKTSSSDIFLDNVKPSMGIISVGEGNRYDHPTQETLDRLESGGISILRTDEKGTIKLELDGKDIIISEEISVEESRAGSVVEAVKLTPALEIQEGMAEVIVGEDVYISEGVYHKKGCKHLEGQKTDVMLRREAESQYKKCDVCIE